MLIDSNVCWAIWDKFMTQHSFFLHKILTDTCADAAKAERKEERWWLKPGVRLTMLDGGTQIRGTSVSDSSDGKKPAVLIKTQLSWATAYLFFVKFSATVLYRRTDIVWPIDFHEPTGYITGIPDNPWSTEIWSRRVFDWRVCHECAYRLPHTY